MNQHLSLINIAAIFFFGIGAQWLAWRLKQPTILFLLLFGIIAGPILGVVQPDLLLGDLLKPFVSLTVGLILFEGGMNLKLAELRDAFSPVRNLLSVGLLVSWVAITGCAHFILGFDWPLSILVGAILFLTGPTVVIPLLKHVRPLGRVNSILKWEGILIDPIGALAAVLVFEVILAQEFPTAIHLVVSGVFKTVIGATLISLIASAGLIIIIKKRWVPETLLNSVTLALLIIGFVLSNLWHSEAGLLFSTLFGIILTNQQFVSISKIRRFKENLQILFISSLFIILAARLNLADIYSLRAKYFLFVMALIFLVRPLSVLVSTRKSNLTKRERLFLSFMAPRGIVAASVASIISLNLLEINYPQADKLVPLAFLTVILTILFYSIVASPLAKLLRLALPEPKGILILGGHYWAREIARALQEQDFEVLIIDTDRHHIQRAAEEGIPAVYANALSDKVIEEIQLERFYNMLALTSNHELNTLATIHFSHILGENHVFQLQVDTRTQKDISPELSGRLLFDSGVTYEKLEELFLYGAELHSKTLFSSAETEAWEKSSSNSRVLLFIIGVRGSLKVVTAEEPLKPAIGETVLYVM